MTTAGNKGVSPEVLGRETYTVLDRETGYKKRIQVTRVRTPSGLLDSLYTDLDRDSVQVLAVTEDREVILVRQWRPNTETEQVELPGGGLSPGEDPQAGALRELREETGYSPGPNTEIKLLGSPRYSPYSTGRRWGFLVTNVSKNSDLDLDPNESLVPLRVPVDKVKDLVLSQPGTLRGEDLLLRCLLRGWV